MMLSHVWKNEALTRPPALLDVSVPLLGFISRQENPKRADKARQHCFSPVAGIRFAASPQPELLILSGF